MKNYRNTIEQKFIHNKGLDLKASVIHKGDHKLLLLDGLLHEFKEHLILNGWSKK